MVRNLQDELDIMERMHITGRYSLRLWVVSNEDLTTSGKVDWVVCDSSGRGAHAANLGRFTWNGELDVPMRAIICAREMISQAYDKLPPIALR